MPGFLKHMSICMFACVSAPEAITTSGVMWHDIYPL